jgi:hypothetical protein
LPVEALDPAGFAISAFGPGVKGSAGKVAIAKVVHLALYLGDVLAHVFEEKGEAGLVAWGVLWIKSVGHRSRARGFGGAAAVSNLDQRVSESNGDPHDADGLDEMDNLEGESAGVNRPSGLRVLKRFESRL